MIQFYDDEEVIAEVHRHWLPLVGSSIAIGLLAILPFAAETFLGSLSTKISDVLSDYSAQILVLECAWILALWMSFAVTWTNHYLDVLIITTKRVIDIDQISLFKRDVAELRVNNIEDIRVEVPGFLASWLKFGTLELQTAAESKSFIMHNVVHPERAKDLISKIRETYYQDMEKGGGIPVTQETE
jgi:hypothetical protein